MKKILLILLLLLGTTAADQPELTALQQKFANLTRVGEVTDVARGTLFVFVTNKTDAEYEAEVKEWEWNRENNPAAYWYVVKPKRQRTHVHRAYGGEWCWVRVRYDDGEWKVWIVSRRIYESVDVGDKIVTPYDRQGTPIGIMPHNPEVHPERTAKR